ncbi:hypothetical protein [Bifidobacterium longum]|uniref:hypothetical protein n=1 Tax=Bifidobacterium longum TaxID=216816 RepID=UPI0018D134D8|nr:hypothetical protein [Bifidobacterium longum]MBH0364313.1 hypothetical protein [Bifidobacterium longum]MBM5830499.1 hypothetical protein [Bifidobacterium longum subsp. suillum]QSG86182.1 hypothetical protein BLS995_05650 [Bifidobacterium longum subsp. suillum]QXT30637.1 hypothetical protein BLS605_06485 [Bifidobacterium longum subsp. suillum]
MELPGLRLERTGQQACEKAGSRVSYPSRTSLCDLYTQGKKLSAKGRRYSQQTLSIEKCIIKSPPSGERERANGKEVPAMGYNANRRDLILIAVCIVLLTLKYLFNI